MPSVGPRYRSQCIHPERRVVPSDGNARLASHSAGGRWRGRQFQALQSDRVAPVSARSNAHDRAFWGELRGPLRLSAPTGRAKGVGVGRRCLRCLRGLNHRHACANRPPAGPPRSQPGPSSRLAGECRRLGRFRRCLNHAAIACQRCSYGRRIRNHTPRPDLNLRRSHARHAARPRYRQLLFGFRSWNWAGELAAWPSSRRRRVDVAIPDGFTCQHCRRVDRPYFFRQAAALWITKNHSLTGQPERCPQMQRSLFGCNIQRRYPAVVACRTQTSGSAGRLAFSRTTSGLLANLTRSGG